MPQTWLRLSDNKANALCPTPKPPTHHSKANRKKDALRWWCMLWGLWFSLPSSRVNARKSVLELNHFTGSQHRPAEEEPEPWRWDGLLLSGECTSAYKDMYLSTPSHSALAKCGWGLEVQTSGLCCCQFSQETEPTPISGIIAMSPHTH